MEDERNVIVNVDVLNNVWFYGLGKNDKITLIRVWVVGWKFKEAKMVEELVKKHFCDRPKLIDYGWDSKLEKRIFVIESDADYTEEEITEKLHEFSLEVATLVWG